MVSIDSINSRHDKYLGDAKRRANEYFDILTKIGVSQEDCDEIKGLYIFISVFSFIVTINKGNSLYVGLDNYYYKTLILNMVSFLEAIIYHLLLYLTKNGDDSTKKILKKYKTKNEYIRSSVDLTKFLSSVGIEQKMSAELTHNKKKDLSFDKIAFSDIKISELITKLKKLELFDKDTVLKEQQQITNLIKNSNRDNVYDALMEFTKYRNSVHIIGNYKEKTSFDEKLFVNFFTLTKSIYQFLLIKIEILSSSKFRMPKSIKEIQKLKEILDNNPGDIAIMIGSVNKYVSYHALKELQKILEIN